MDVRSGEVLAYAGNVYDPGTGVREPASTSFPRRAAAAACSNRSSTPGCSTTARRLPTMLFPDVPTYYRDFTPQNYNRTFDGAVPADRVVERSLNVPSVRMLDKYGRENFLSLVRALGFRTIDRSADHYGLSLILGGAEITLWDLTAAYMLMAAKLGGQETIRRRTTTRRRPRPLRPATFPSRGVRCG